MKKPKFDLKNVKTFIGREGYGLNADLYVNGKHVCFVRDDASGGPMDYDWNIKHDESGMPIRHPKDSGKEHHLVMKHQAEFDLLHAWVKEQPKQKSEELSFEYDYCLDLLIDDILAEKERKKFDTKMKKDMKTKILIGKKNEKGEVDSYSAYKMFHPKPLPERGILQNFIDRTVKPKLKDGEEILNTNLEELGIKI